MRTRTLAPLWDSMATGLKKHFQIKWDQDYVLGIICPPPDYNRVNLTHKSKWEETPLPPNEPPCLGSSAFHAQAD